MSFHAFDEHCLPETPHNLSENDISWTELDHMLFRAGTSTHPATQSGDLSALLSHSNVIDPVASSMQLGDLLAVDLQLNAAHNQPQQGSLSAGCTGSDDLDALALATCLPSTSSQQQKPLAVSNRGVSSKKTRIRAKGKVDILQKQLDEVKQRFNHLSLANRELQVRHHVLNKMIECLDIYEELVRQIAGGYPEGESSLVEANPTASVIVAKYKELLKDLTPTKFITLYKRILSDASRWVALADAGLTPEQETKLKAVVDEGCDAIYYAMVAYPTVIETASIQLLKQFPDDASEEEHWMQVIQSMELSEEQEMQFMAARDIILRVHKRADAEREELGGTISSSIVPPVNWTTIHAMGTMPGTEGEEELVERITCTLNKQCSMLLVFDVFMCRLLLTPLQVARCALHAYPLLPTESIVLHAVAAHVQRRNKGAAPAAAGAAAASVASQC